MTCVLVTSDWHIGARMASAGAAAAAFREQKFETARRIVAMARDEGAAALFLLGDTFDGDRVGAEDIHRTAAILAEASCAVLVLPGNHDHWHAGGALQAFQRQAEREDRIKLLLEESPLVVEGLAGVTFFPCPVLRHASVADPTRWIPPRAAAHGLRVGLIHGGLDRAGWGGKVPERVAEARDLDLALLGDWHKPVDGPDGRTYYPGAPEPGGFDEEHEGGVILADLVADGPRARRLQAGKLRFRRLELALEPEAAGGRGVKAVEEAVAAAGPPSPSAALRLRLSGSLSPEELNRLEAVLEGARAAGWAFCDLDLRVAAARAPDLESFEEESLRAVARRIWESGGDEAVRRRALVLLRERAEAAR